MRALAGRQLYLLPDLPFVWTPVRCCRAKHGNMRTPMIDEDASADAPHLRRLGYVAALAVAVVMGVLLLEIPVQLSDSFLEFPLMADASLADVVTAEVHNGPYFRPFLRGLIKVVHELSAGHYYLAFRGFQVVQLLILLLLVVRMLRVKSHSGLLVLPLGIAALVGIHTFAGAIVEAFPINTFLTILICCAAAMNLVQARGGIAVDAGAIALLVTAVLTLESGLLIWVIFAVAYGVGYRGVSRRAVILATSCVVAYFVGRLVLLGGAPPGLNERSAGFGFGVLNPDELVRRFGSNPIPFYLYNVVSAISCVLFAEPRGGVWAFVRNVTTGVPETWQVVNVVTSTATTLVIVRYALSRLPSWRRREFTEPDRFVVIFLAVLPANALFAAGYEKDVILSPAGLFYVAAAYMVLRERVASGSSSAPGVALAIAPALVLVISVGWAIRYVGIHYSLRARAEAVRNEWAYYDDWAREQKTDVSLDAKQSAIKQQLFDDAVNRAPRAPQISLGAAGTLFDVTQ